MLVVTLNEFWYNMFNCFGIDTKLITLQKVDTSISHNVNFVSLLKKILAAIYFFVATYNLFHFYTQQNSYSTSHYAAL